MFSGSHSNKLITVITSYQNYLTVPNAYIVLYHTDITIYVDKRHGF